MGYINFSFGSSYDERTKEKGKELEKKIDRLLENFDLTSNEFFDEILQHTLGFYISSPNRLREAEKDRRSINAATARIPNFFFRLQLDDYATTNILKANTTVLLKGDLIINNDNTRNYVIVKDVYLTEHTDQQPYEYHCSVTSGYRNSNENGFISDGENFISMDLAKNTPDIVNKDKFKEFINKWKTYLEFEKSITLGNMKSYKIKDIKYKSVCEIADNAVNREEHEGHIIKTGKGNIFVDRNSPKLRGDEPSLTLLSVSVDSNVFNPLKEGNIKKRAISFARMGLSIIGNKGKEQLTSLLEELKKSNSRNKKGLRELTGFELDNWLSLEYEDKNNEIIFYFIVDDNQEDGYIKKTIDKIGEEKHLAYIASGEIALYTRGMDTLDKLEKGDTKNPWLAGFLIEPDKFDTGIDLFNENNINFALENLNQIQKEAIIKCLNSNSIFLLQGPPGTGKTQTITEIVYQFNKMGKKVLLSSQTHIAIDNVIERLPQELDILSIRLVRNRSKVNKQYLPDMVLDNFYNAVYYKYQGKIDNYEKYEKNIAMLEQLFNNSKTRYEKLEKRLEEVKKLEDDRNHHTKELSLLRADENEIESDCNNMERSLIVFREYYLTKLPFESVLDEYNYAPLVEQLGILAKKYRIQEQDDFYNYAVAFKRVAGKNRINHLETLLVGGKKPEDLAQVEGKIEDLKRKIVTFEKYGNNPPGDLKQKMKEELQKKKDLDRKYETDGVKHMDVSKEKFNFVKTDGILGEATIKEELKAINEFVVQYNKIMAQVLGKDEFNKLKVESDELKAWLSSTENKIRRITVKIEKNESDIIKMNTPIKEERGKLDEYFNEFYTGKLNGASLPVTEKEKFKEISAYIEQQKADFENYKADFLKVQVIYESLVKHLKDRDTFVAAQRGKYTNDLLKKIANVYGMTCTSGQYFSKEALLGENNGENNNESNIVVDELNIREIDFDVVIIDEVSKATPIEILIPIICGKSVVLVGDQRQLPPIFKYRENMFEGKTEEEKEEILKGESLDNLKKMVESSLFEEIYDKLKRNKAMLTEQYRFNESIMKCVNVFYDGKLTLGAGEEQNNKKKHYLDVSIKNKKGENTPIFCRKNSTYWFDSHTWADGTTAYSGVQEGETSYRNDLEVKLTVELLLLLEKGYGELRKNNPEEYKMAAADGKKPSVAVISMYGKHISSIKAYLKSRKIQRKDFENISIDISTVDNYQGKEQDIILVNMVANTKSKEPGEFLKKFNRINVAISRAKTMLIMVGSREYYRNVSVNVPNMDTGDDNMINAYYEIHEKCEFRWAHAAGILGIEREPKKETSVK